MPGVLPSMLTLLPGEWAQGLKPGGVLCLKECCYPGAAFWVDLKDNSIMRWEVVEGVGLAHTTRTHAYNCARGAATTA